MGWMDGCMDGYTDGRMDVHIHPTRANAPLQISPASRSLLSTDLSSMQLCHTCHPMSAQLPHHCHAPPLQPQHPMIRRSARALQRTHPSPCTYASHPHSCPAKHRPATHTHVQPNTGQPPTLMSSQT
eukprot:4318-Chlamydomonas_euryale.AAC.4